MQSKPFNLLVTDTKQSIINTINSSGLPISVVRLIIEDILNIIIKSETEILSTERKQHLSAIQLESEQKVINQSSNPSI